MAPDCPIINFDALAGLVNLANIGWFFAIAVGSVCTVIIAFQLYGILKHVPGLIWEIILYGLSAAAIASPYWLNNTHWDDTINALTTVGCVLFAGSLMLSGHIHKVEPNQRNFFGTLLVVYAGLAIHYQSEPIAFLAVAALLALCGFTIMTDTLVVAMGYEESERVPSGTLVALILTAIVLNFANVDLGHFDVFKLGFTWIGSIVGSIGLLIMSTRWYGYGDKDRPNYVFMQFVTIGLYAAGIVLGAIANVDVVMYVSAVFLVIYLTMKPHEIESGILGHAFFGLIAAIAVGYGAHWLNNNMEVVQAYLETVR